MFYYEDEDEAFAEEHGTAICARNHSVVHFKCGNCSLIIVVCIYPASFPTAGEIHMTDILKVNHDGGLVFAVVVRTCFMIRNIRSVRLVSYQNFLTVSMSRTGENWSRSF